MSWRGKEEIPVRDCSPRAVAHRELLGQAGSACPGLLSRAGERLQPGLAKEQRAAPRGAEHWARGSGEEREKPSWEMAYF